jgi:hypothetical protein
MTNTRLDLLNIMEAKSAPCAIFHHINVISPPCMGTRNYYAISHAHFVSFLFFYALLPTKKTSILSSSISFTTILPIFGFIFKMAQNTFSAFSLHLICSKLNDGKTIWGIVKRLENINKEGDSLIDFFPWFD